MDDLPQPLVPADVDLRGYEHMPMYGDRLFKSETWISASDEARVAALRLWWQSYAHEVPAASLPQNDRLLAEYAGFGTQVRAWLKVKAQALRGFIQCSDGRLYHQQLATLAMDAWVRREHHLDGKANEKERQRRLRTERKELFEKLRTHGHVPAYNISMAALRELGHACDGHAIVTRTDTAKDRTGQERIGYKEKLKAMSGKPDPDPPPPVETPPPAGDAKAERVKQLRKEAVGILLFLNEKTGRNYDATSGPNVDLVVGRLKQGATVDKCRQVIARMARKWTGDEKMDQYLRPKTLFGATNFAQYAGEIVDQPGGDE